MPLLLLLCTAYRQPTPCIHHCSFLETAPSLFCFGCLWHVQDPASMFDLPAEPCSAAACGQYSFVTSPWGACSALCGSDGTASRNVSCQHNGVQVDPTSDEYTQNCLPLVEPFSVQPCFATPCEPYMWRTGAWSNCTSGMQNRTVSCQRVRGGSADASVGFCLHCDNVCA